MSDRPSPHVGRREITTLTPIVSTKLTPPRSAGRIVPRERLLEQLMDARRRRCLVLQGPAGWGKTTTIVAWRQALLPLGFDVAWLTLTADDNELSRFIDYLLASVAQVDPAITREASLLGGRGVDSEAVERTMISLVRGVSKYGRELVLVLDDMHYLGDRNIQEALQWLLDYAPPNLHLVLVSRSAVPLSLARLRAQDLALELDLRDLRFSPLESEQFLKAQLGDIDKRDARLLHELTDGWVAGLQLLSIDWKQKHADTAHLPQLFVHTRVQDARTFADYFEREVLSRVSPPELELLTRVSICNRFCAPLCAVLVGQPGAIAEAASLLARLEHDNLFIVQVESAERETWYRLHPLLRETLRERLSLRGESERRQVHLAAWQWFRDLGHLDEAVHHAVRAGEADAAADLVEQRAQSLFARGDLRKLIGLVRRLPVEQAEARLQLRIWMIRMRVYARELDASAQSIERLQADLPDNDPHAQCYVVLLQATLAVQRDDTEAAMAVLPQLLQIPENVDAVTIGARNNILSWLYMHRGEYERGRRIQLDAPQLRVDGAPLLGTGAGSLFGRCLIGLSHAMEGQMIQAERVYRDVLYEADQCGSACADPTYLAAALLGEVLYEINDTEAALRLLEHRVDVLERVSIPDSVLRVMMVLSGVHWLAGRQLEAFNYLERLEDYASNLRLDRLLAYSLGEQVQRRLERGERDTAAAVLARLEALAGQYTHTEHSPLGEINVVAQRARIRWCVAHEDLDQSMALLEPLIAYCETRGWQRVAAHLQLQRAAIDARNGRASAARENVLLALRRGHRLGLVRSLLDADPSALDLIRDLASQATLDPVLTFYVERLQSAHHVPLSTSPAVPAAPAATRRPSTNILSMLSDREIDVVRLLAQAMPNKKIARTLGVSPETVKWHLSNVYGKLGVTGRDEAVARVRDLEWSSASGGGRPDPGR